MIKKTKQKRSLFKSKVFVLLPVKLFSKGEDPESVKNRFLGSFTLRNISPVPVGDPKLDVIFKIDENCILTVTAVDKQNGNKDSIEILPDKGRLTDSQLIEMIHEICPPPMEIDLDDD
uniref:Uncharacterized protein n=1 Tax=Panagrolaimus davidi TaxID=227884 RepID=A0A914QGY7_9BILA